MKRYSSALALLLLIASAASALSCPLVQGPPFTPPELISMKYSARCPNVGNVSVEVEDAKGKLRVVSIDGFGHSLSPNEQAGLDKVLSAYIGLRSVAVSCQRTDPPFVVIEVFTRNDPRGIIEVLTLEWRKAGYQLFTGTYLRR